MSPAKKKVTLRDLDINNIGGWPRNFQMAFAALVALVIFFLFWYLFIGDKREQLAGLERQEADLRTQFEDKAGRAANLGPLTQQLAQMEQQLQQMLRQLPSRTEMPDLIVDISQTALATGLENQLFEPGPEVPKEFYAEKPIKLRMIGSFHQFGAFVSGVASLPRVVIMTMHDISLKPSNPGPAGSKVGANSSLELSGTVKTYRYLDESETAEAKKPPNAAAQGGK